MNKLQLDVLLVVPPVWENQFLSNREDEYTECLGSGYIAASLRKHGISVQILDCTNYKITLLQCIDIILLINPRILAISALSVQSKPVSIITNKVKKYNNSTYTILGGYYPTLDSEKVFEDCQDIDVIMKGEGETTCYKVVQALLSGHFEELENINGISFRKGNDIIATPKVILPHNLDDIPFPERDTLPMIISNGGEAHIVSSRGCYANCSFCSISAFYRTSSEEFRYRQRSVTNICDEIESLIERFNIKEIMIYDDNFFNARDRTARAYDFGNELIRRNIKIKYNIMCRPTDVEEEAFKFLKNTGLDGVTIGIESLSQRDLALYKKGVTPDQIRKAVAIIDNCQINLYATYITFNYETSLEALECNFEFFKSRLGIDCGKALKYNCIFPISSILTYESGTPISEEGHNQNINQKSGYKLADKSIDSFKRIACLLFSCVLPLNDNLAICEHYYKKFKGKNEENMRKSLDLLWHRIAEMCVDSCCDFLQLIKNMKWNLQSVLEKFQTVFNRYINLSADIELYIRMNIEIVMLQHINFYRYHKDGEIYVYDISTSANIYLTNRQAELLGVIEKNGSYQIMNDTEINDLYAEEMEWYRSCVGRNMFVWVPKVKKPLSQNIIMKNIKMIFGSN